MGALDRILNRAMDRGTGQALERSWPVGHGNVYGWESTWGHDNQKFSPDEAQAETYATANDIYTIATSRARLLSGLDLRFYKGSGTKKKLIEPEQHRAVDLYGYVNQFWGPSMLGRMDEMSMCIWGETYWAIEPPSEQSPLGEIWWLKPSQMRPIPDPDRYLRGFAYQPIASGPTIYFAPDEIVWLRYPNPLDEMAALSPLVAAKLAADTAAAMMKSNQKLFTQGLQIAGLVTPSNPELNFSKDQADDLEKYLGKRFTGPDKAHRWAVLRYDAQFRQMSMSPKDAEYVSGLGVTFRQVARAFGMQAALHGDLEQASPGDTEALERIEWARTLKPDAQLRSQQIKEQYLPRFAIEGRNAPNHCEFDFTQVPALQESEGAVWEREAAMLDRSLLTINEWRDRRGLPPVPWGDAPWMPLNKGQWKDGQIQVPGQPDAAAAGVAPAEEGLPQDAVQGGPQLADEQGVPLPKPPDDEVLPTNLPTRSVHMQARDFLAQGDVQDFLASAFKRNGHDFGRRNGHGIGAK